jgi:hypothetical protein
MGASVTANNAGAKLSSLAHRPEKEKTKDNRKRSSEELQQQDEGPHIYRKYVLAPNSSPEDFGYLDASTESSDDNAEDSSSISGSFFMEQG